MIAVMSDRVIGRSRTALRACAVRACAVWARSGWALTMA
jgi:hypothetical protein